MGTHPAVTAKECIRVLGRLGFQFDRSTGSHRAFVRPGHRYTVIVPYHGGRTLPRKTFRSILHQAGVSPEEFFALL